MMRNQTLKVGDLFTYEDDDTVYEVLSFGENSMQFTDQITRFRINFGVQEQVNWFNGFKRYEYGEDE